ncbi:MAG: iron-containing alcohol dehydrogenase [Defluviitaleaceae bacterium]|nr:iron-containing alcohol dehydrogenase [Defluviitaleaceae bacterium]
MIDFTFHPRTKIVFGKDSEKKLPEELKEFGVTGVLIHYGMGSAVQSGLIDKIKNILEQNGIKYVELGGVKPNPRLNLVKDGIELCKNKGLNFILAVGGGSVIDSSKAIGVGAAYDGDVWDFYIKSAEPKKTLPVGVILTLASAGSETSTASVIRNEEENTKRSLVTDLIRPAFAILNPTLAFGVNKFSLACGISDIIMHTLDRYFTNQKDTDLTDRISEGIIITAMKCGKTLIEDPTNYEAMANIFWTGSLSHNEITGIGKMRDFSVHALERGISGSFDTAHPAGLTILWHNWAKYVYKSNIQRFAQFAVNVLNIRMNFENPEKTALEGIEKMTEFFKKIGMPISFEDAKINPTDSQINEIVDYAFLAAPKIGTFFELSKQDAINIFQNAR